MRALLTSLAVVTLSLVSGSAFADGMRCGSRLVSDGDPIGEVRSVCGAPDASAQRKELRAVRRWVDGPCVNDRGTVRCGYLEERMVEVVIDEWMYDFGPSALIRHLTFEQGRLIHVATGGYGTKTE
jgi:hypothetical protein